MDKNEFRNNVKDILNHVSDTAYLENNNLISIFLSGEELKPGRRVQALREVIRESINFLQPPEGTPSTAPAWRCHRILTLRYLQLQEWHNIESELGLSQRQVQRDLKKGLDALITILWDRINSSGKNTESQTSSDQQTEEQYDEELIKEELKNWEITSDLVNLHNLAQHALQLCSSLIKSDLNDRVNLTEVDRTIHVMVDQVLTKQGLYKILSMVDGDEEGIKLDLKTRKLNEFFIELSFTFKHQKPISQDPWKMGRLFFTIQGLNQEIKAGQNETCVTIVFPMRKQISCLVIDDVASVRRLIERMVGSYGIQVFGADNYSDALNLIQFMKPDFILLDILMPKMDGWQMITNLKANPNVGDIPIIISSVLYEPELSKAVGAKGYIRKPINRLELIKQLQELKLIQQSFSDPGE